MIRLDERSIKQRRAIIDIVAKSKRGHIGSAFSVVEILRVLYDDILHYDSKRPQWSDRDRFVFSKGHGCLALYVILAEKSFFPGQWLDAFCSFGSPLGGHPEHGRTPGVEASTGALGHGLPIGVGMALAARIDNRDHRVFVLTGDGECDEVATLTQDGETAEIDLQGKAAKLNQGNNGGSRNNGNNGGQGGNN